MQGDFNYDSINSLYLEDDLGKFKKGLFVGDQDISDIQKSAFFSINKSDEGFDFPKLSKTYFEEEENVLKSFSVLLEINNQKNEENMKTVATSLYVKEENLEKIINNLTVEAYNEIFPTEAKKIPREQLLCLKRRFITTTSKTNTNNSNTYNKKIKNSSSLDNIQTEENKITRGRNLKDSQTIGCHNKFDKDNIATRVRSNCLYKLLKQENINIKNSNCDYNKYELLKINYNKIIKINNKKENLSLLDSPLRTIFSNDISPKYKEINDLGLEEKNENEIDLNIKNKIIKRKKPISKIMIEEYKKKYKYLGKTHNKMLIEKDIMNGPDNDAKKLMQKTFREALEMFTCKKIILLKSESKYNTLEDTNNLTGKQFEMLIDLLKKVIYDELKNSKSPSLDKLSEVSDYAKSFAKMLFNYEEYFISKKYKEKMIKKEK